jgi:hypothetical protein
MRGLRCVARAALAAACLLAGCAVGPSAPAGPSPLDGTPIAPWTRVNGGWLAARTGPATTPAPMMMPNMRGAFMPLRFPSAVAILANDVLIADSAAQTIYRYDITMQSLAPVTGLGVPLGTRLAIGSDLSAYVLDPARRVVLRIGRDGRLLQTLGNPQVIAQPVDFALREAFGDLLLADATLAQLIVLRMAGNIAFAVTPRDAEGERAGPIAAVAARGERVCTSHPSSRQVYCRDGNLQNLVVLGDPALRLPGPLAIDRFGRVLVIDTAANDLKMFAGTRMIAAIPAAALGVAEITALAVDGNFLAIADASGAQVALFFLRPPAE